MVKLEDYKKEYARGVAHNLPLAFEYNGNYYEIEYFAEDRCALYCHKEGGNVIVLGEVSDYSKIGELEIDGKKFFDILPMFEYFVAV